MSAETREWLATNILVGDTEHRGNAWHYMEGDDNHYAGAIPVDDVMRRLFHWQVKEAPAYADLGAFESLKCPDHKVLYRSDNRGVLGIVGSDYKVHEPEAWLLDGPAAMIGGASGEVIITGAGLLQGGAVAYVEMGVPETTTVQGFTYRSNLLAYTSFNGRLSSGYNTTNKVTVCDNTLAIALADAKRSGTQYRVRHTRNSRLSIAGARSALHLLSDETEQFTRGVQELLDWKVNEGQWEQFLDQLAPVGEGSKRANTIAQGKRSKLWSLYCRDPRSAPWHGTALGVLQAMNTFDSHYATVKGAGRVERNMMNAITGKQAESDGRTLELLRGVCAAV